MFSHVPIYTTITHNNQSEELPPVLVPFMFVHHAIIHHRRSINSFYKQAISPDARQYNKSTTPRPKRSTTKKSE